MKKIISLLLVFAVMVLFSVKAFAGVAEGVAFASDGQWSAALGEYQKALPSLTGMDVPLVQTRIAGCLQALKSYDLAIAEYKKVVGVVEVDGKKIKTGNQTIAQWDIGLCLYYQDKIDEAIAAYQKVRTINDGGDGWYTADALIRAGDLLNAQDKAVEAQEEYLLVSAKGMPIHYYLVAMGRIDATIVGKERYGAFLTKLLLAVPAKAENAEFLGQVKSEIEKLK